MALAVSPLVRICAADVAGLPDLRIVAATSTGYDHIDVAAVVATGACVTHTPGYSDIEVADHVIAMTGALLRRLHVADAMMRRGRYSSRAARAADHRLDARRRRPRPDRHARGTARPVAWHARARLGAPHPRGEDPRAWR